MYLAGETEPRGPHLKNVVLTDLLAWRDVQPQLGRIRIGLPQLRETLDSVPGLRFLPLDLDQLDQFAALTAIRDPFDRLIMSAARSLKADLISYDETLGESGLTRIVWA